MEGDYCWFTVDGIVYDPDDYALADHQRYQNMFALKDDHPYHDLLCGFCTNQDWPCNKGIVWKQVMGD